MNVRANEATDADIIEGLRRGEPWAAEVLCTKLRPVIHRRLRRVYSVERHDHDDLVQSVLEQIIRTLIDPAFHATCSLRAWAAVIASRVGIDALRSRTRERVVFCDEVRESPEVLGAPEAMLLERKLEARSELQTLESVLEQMKPEQSMTVLLHDLYGHDLTEIASLMGVTAAAAQSRLVRGRKELMRQRAARRTMDSVPDDASEE
jgi:RNA polymerase sigma-70 factor, ECF subfamily